MPMELRIVLAVADAAERAALAERLADGGFKVTAPPGMPDLGAALADAAGLVLDARLALPDAPALCAALRRAGHTLPILVLHDGIDGQVVRCLDAGANDAIARPVRALELVARVRAQLRHHGASAGTALTVGPYLFRPDQRELEEPSGRVIRLTATESSILRFLHRAGGSVVTRQVLLHEVWGYPRWRDHTHGRDPYLSPAPQDRARSAAPAAAAVRGFRLPAGCFDLGAGGAGPLSAGFPRLGIIAGD